MSKRPRGVPPATRSGLVVLLTLAAMLIVVGPAMAVEEQGGEQAPRPDIEELCARNEIVAEFCPEPYEEPSVFPPILYALLAVGAIISIVLFAMYMRWLPNFAQERQAKAKGRR